MKGKRYLIVLPTMCVTMLFMLLVSLTWAEDEIPENCTLMLADPSTCAPICSTWSGKPN